MKVDLIVIPLFSALKSVFELIKAYEEDGIVRIKPGIKFPYSYEYMRYNPNMETEFNAQILMAHDCFYEYRESADFIALLDLDDLLITTNFDSLSENFRLSTQQFPNAAFFSVNRLESTFLKQSLWF